MIIFFATSINSELFNEELIRLIRKGNYAGIIAVKSDPRENLSILRQIRFVMKNGEIYLSPN